MKKLSTYRLLATSNTHTGKPKTSNHTEHDLKMTSSYLRSTSIGLHVTSNEPVKNEKKKLKGGGPNEDGILGKDLIEQGFSSN